MKYIYFEIDFQAASATPSENNCEICGKYFSLIKHKNEHKKKHNPDWKKTYCPVPGCDKSYLDVKNWRKHFKLHHTNKTDCETTKTTTVKIFERQLMAKKENLHPSSDEPHANVPAVKSVLSATAVTNRSREIENLRAENIKLQSIIMKILKIKIFKRIVNRAKRAKRLNYKTINLDIQPDKNLEILEDPVNPEISELSEQSETVPANPASLKETRIPVMPPSPTLNSASQTTTVCDLREVLVNRRKRRMRNEIWFADQDELNNCNKNVKSPPPNSLISDALRQSSGPISKREYF